MSILRNVSKFKKLLPHLAQLLQVVLYSFLLLLSHLNIFFSMCVLLDQPLVLFFELGHLAFLDRHNFIMVGFLFTLLLFELPLLFAKVALHLFI